MKTSNAAKLSNPFALPGRWYKANLHTHTTTSDGKLPLAQRVAQYRRAGYDVLAITDHRATNDVAGLSDERMLVISGMEYHPACPTTAPVPYHIVALHVPHGLRFAEPSDANRCIAHVRRVGGVSILAHPSWCGQGFEDFRTLRGLIGVEVYNATCDRHGRASSESEWAIALDRGVRIPAVATDDAHCVDVGDVFEAWTWLKMPQLTAACVLKALRAGACYASCGPRIHGFRVAGGKIQVRCSPAAAIYFVGGPGQGKRRRAEEDASVRGFAIDLPTKWPYVRAVVADARGRRAWTNPIFLRSCAKR